ncbi:AAA family ATPase [Actinomyces oris]|uniref:AlbA family DNA-binding domain-containing protein n=1 Tax=Actinomyces oris TaxID=544580 RepID=UPI00094DB303|nr:helix-turn-helix domain-containing protein [Actinomyces oris]OLO77536.1 AAA family ATPase [Actinomyces oris]
MDEYLRLDQYGRTTAPEGKTLEFKRDLSSTDGPLRTLVAFANSAGGRLVVGVADDGTIVGVDDPLTEEERIANLINDRISPQLVPAIDLVTLRGKTVLIVDVPLSTRRPHYITRQGPEAGVYVRLGSTTRQADPALVAELERNARGIAFEDLREPRAALEDLDLEVLSKLRGRNTSVADLLARGLAVKQGDQIVPTNAGILAACPDPTRFLPSAWVQCGRLRGPHGTDIFDQTEIHGPMPLAVDHAVEFLLKHAYKTAVFGQVRRRDIYSIPIEPIREVIVNALVHASYAERSTPIRIGFYDDRIQVDSPGLLLPGMTIDTMRRVSRLRNPALARIFREAGIMEQWGTGVQRVFEQVAEAGLPEPVIEEVQDRVRVTIYVPSHDPKHADAHGSRAPESGEQRSEEHSHPEHTYTHSNDGRYDGRYDVVMMRAAASGPVHRNILLEAAGLKPLSQNYTRHVVPLVSRGLLAMTVPDKPRSKAQRYILTDEGRAYLRHLTEGSE